MENRPWYAVSWRKLALVLMLPVTIAAAFSLYMWLHPPATLACVLNQNGALIKAWNADCKAPEAEGIVLQLKP